MSGIPAHLMTPLREVLADCEQFETNRGLRNLFTDARIRPWRDNLPQADTLMGRVDGVISYLHDKKHSDGSNALVLMLLALASTVDQQDDRYERLKALASALDESAPNSSKMTMAAQPTHDPGSRDVADPSKPLDAKTFTASPARTLDSQDSTKTGNVDFFISYNRHDKQWAEWIAWQLENAGYTTIIQAWDFRPGANFVTDMQQAAMNSERTIAVLSQDYLASKFTQPEWSAAFARDPTGKEGLLLPVKVRECDLKGLLPQIVYIDLTDLSSEQAAEELLAGVKRGRAKPLIEPKFPRATAPEFPDNL
jgi:hypothetical protein